MQSTDLLHLFLASKRAAGLSRRTVDWYDGQIRWFFEWLKNVGIGGAEWLQPTTIRAALSAEAERVEQGEISAYTLEARFRALNVFFSWLKEWLLEERGISIDPMRGIKRPKTPKLMPRQVTVAQMDRLMASIPESGDWVDLRDRLAILLLFWLGLRRSEVVNLSIPDFDLGQRQVLIRGTQRGTAGAKGGKDRHLPFPPVVGSALLAYLMSGPPAAGTKLFVSATGQRKVRGALTDNGLRQMVERRCQAAGMPHLNPHSFRHGLAMALLNDGGADLAMVSRLLGHSTMAVTKQFYADYTDDGLRNAYDAAVRGIATDR
jgi:integrase/recombinase XerD